MIHMDRHRRGNPNLQCGQCQLREEGLDLGARDVLLQQLELLGQGLDGLVISRTSTVPRALRLKQGFAQAAHLLLARRASRYVPTNRLRHGCLIRAEQIVIMNLRLPAQAVSLIGSH